MLSFLPSTPLRHRPYLVLIQEVHGGTDLSPWNSMVPGTDDQGLAKAGFMSLPLVIDSGMSTQQKWSKNHIPGCAELLGRRSFPPNRTDSYRDDSDPESCLWVTISYLGRGS